MNLGVPGEFRAGGAGSRRVAWAPRHRWKPWKVPDLGSGLQAEGGLTGRMWGKTANGSPPRQQRRLEEVCWWFGLEVLMATPSALTAHVPWFAEQTEIVVFPPAVAFELLSDGYTCCAWGCTEEKPACELATGLACLAVLPSGSSSVDGRQGGVLPFRALLPGQGC